MSGSQGMQWCHLSTGGTIITSMVLPFTAHVDCLLGGVHSMTPALLRGYPIFSAKHPQVSISLMLHFPYFTSSWFKGSLWEIWLRYTLPAILGFSLEPWCSIYRHSSNTSTTWVTPKITVRWKRSHSLFVTATVTSEFLNGPAWKALFGHILGW